MIVTVMAVATRRETCAICSGDFMMVYQVVRVISDMPGMARADQYAGAPANQGLIDRTKGEENC